MVHGSRFMVKGYFNVNANLDLNGERELVRNAYELRKYKI